MWFLVPASCNFLLQKTLRSWNLHAHYTLESTFEAASFSAYDIFYKSLTDFPYQTSNPPQLAFLVLDCTHGFYAVEMPLHRLVHSCAPIVLLYPMQRRLCGLLRFCWLLLRDKTVWFQSFPPYLVFALVAKHCSLHVWQCFISLSLIEGAHHKPCRPFCLPRGRLCQVSPRKRSLY